jgi:hypothetical protein
MTESMILSAIAAIGGLFVAHWLQDAITRLLGYQLYRPHH